MLHDHVQQVDNIEQLNDGCDVLIASGAEIGLRPGPDRVRSSLFLYARIPSGHRLEPCAGIVAVARGGAAIAWTDPAATRDDWDAPPAADVPKSWGSET
jgi:hypothetical protein